MNITFDLHELLDFGEKISSSSFDEYMKEATLELTKILQDMLYKNTPVKTGNLCASWGGAENMPYKIVKTGNGFLVTLTNGAVNEDNEHYGEWVNDGHWSYNQYGGPYKFIKGQFFVEFSVLESESQVYSVVNKYLEEWFEWCCDG